MLIAARAAAGPRRRAAGPGSLAILAATFEGAARGKAVGTWTAWTGIATVLGPAGGGALVEALSWRAIFWVNMPLIVVTVVAHAAHAVEESRTRRRTARSTGSGIVLSAPASAGPVFALIQQPTHGWGDPMVFVPLIAGIAAVRAFLVWESRAAHPMLDLGLFRIRNFSVTNLETLIVYAGLIGAFFFVTLFLQQTSATRRSRPASRRPRSRCCCSSSRRASGGSRPAPGRGCRCASARSSAASGCCC